MPNSILKLKLVAGNGIINQKFVFRFVSSESDGGKLSPRARKRRRLAGALAFHPGGRLLRASAAANHARDWCFESDPQGPPVRLFPQAAVR
ncbi:unnamed protein product [Dracunculus medinensis]|uniref:Uncharacterized protein n=1 Tax=Dracunculus medinensis TaxID=318479 RepID=A0A0N4U9T1_DRAME|nr:unnamed protein product [Dracunculus medinensis]